MISQPEWIVSSSNRGIYSGLNDLIRSRSVLYALVNRELKSRYRGSILGFTWVLGKPILTLLIFSLVIGEILGASRSVEYFALYLFVGLMFWGFFSEAITSGTHAIVGAEGLVQKISFPREILPISAVVVSFINLLIQIPILLVGYLAFGKWPSFEHLNLLIPAFGILILFTLALALLLSAMNVYVRDIKPLTDLTLMLLMYSVPIIYSWTFVKEKIYDTFQSYLLFDFYVFNPITAVVVNVQDALWPGNRFYSDGSIAEKLYEAHLPFLWIMILLSFLFLIFCYKIFLRLEPNFAREL